MIESVRNSVVALPHDDLAGTEPYFLKLGDTFEGLCERFGLDDAASRLRFSRLNPGLESGRLVPGQMVRVPAGALSPAAEPAAEAPKPAASAETSWTRGFNRRIARQNDFNTHVEAARDRWDQLDPAILKSVLAQESGFTERVSNKYGYAGIAQLGVVEAKGQGLETGASRMRRSHHGRLLQRAYVDGRDERLSARRAIPAAAGLLKRKAALLDSGFTTKKGTRLKGFSELGRPRGDDYWKFVTAAYNGGEGTVLLAMRYAYGSNPPGEVRWDDLVRAPGGDVRQSPLWRAIRAAGMNPTVKFDEISTYARDVVARARQ